VKSVEHLQTWIKKSASLQSELLIQPLDLSFAILEKSLETGFDVVNTRWWAGEDKAQVLEPEQTEASNKLSESVFKRDQKKTQNEILEVAKKQHMNTDVKKTVF
jgi:hypothetical protein